MKIDVEMQYDNLVSKLCWIHVKLQIWEEEIRFCDILVILVPRQQYALGQRCN